MGERLVPWGDQHLSARASWLKMQHIITFIISPGIVRVGASIYHRILWWCAGFIKHEGVNQSVVCVSGIFLSPAAPEVPTPFKLLPI